MFFHDVACKIAECDLSEIGMTVEYKPINVQDLGEDVWKGIVFIGLCLNIKHQYVHFCNAVC